MRSPRLLAAATVTAVLPLLAAAPALASSGGSAVTPTYGTNTYAYATSYGEPAIAVSPVDSRIFASTPGEGGAVLGTSTDQGATWTKLPTVVPPGTSPGSQTGGSDSEVVVARDGTVYIGDLTINGIEVSRLSADGRTIQNQVFVGSSADREWLATDGPHGENVYLVWHELSTGTMLFARSTDRGTTFGPPQTIYSNPSTVAQSAHNGTSIGQVVSDGKGHVAVTYGVSLINTTDTTYGTPPITTIKVSVSNDYGKTFTDYDVNPGTTDANYGNFWMASAYDAGGTLYAVYSGYRHKGEPLHIWLQQSTDNGLSWTPQYQVDDAGGQDLFGWVAGGGPGVAVVSWYHTDAPNKDADGIDWSVKVAQVRGLGSGAPQVLTSTASDHSVHHGPICTLGLFCGVAPGSSADRTLLDFFKVAVAPDGMPEVVWSDNNRADGVKDSTGKPVTTGVGFARQVSGPSALDATVDSPSPVVPETPYAALVPLLAIGALGLGLTLARRRRASSGVAA